MYFERVSKHRYKIQTNTIVVHVKKSSEKSPKRSDLLKLIIIIDDPMISFCVISIIHQHANAKPNHIFVKVIRIVSN